MGWRMKNCEMRCQTYDTSVSSRVMSMAIRRIGWLIPPNFVTISVYENTPTLDDRFPLDTTQRTQRLGGQLQFGKTI